MQGGHTTGYNHCSVGVCFEGNFETEHMSDAQLKAGQEVLSMLTNLYPSARVKSHSALNATACPGKNFPFDWILNPDDEGDAERPSNDPPEWARAAWEWAKVEGITDGTRPLDTATRAEIITMLWRALK